MKWFKHEARANRDAKIEKLMSRFGADGYALYWLCLELITDRIEADCIDFELEHDAESLGGRLKVDTIRVEEIMRWMVKEGLFEAAGDRITCLKLAKRLDKSLLRSPALLKIQSQIRDNSELSGKLPEDSDQNRLDENRREERGDKSAPKKQFGEYKHVRITQEEHDRLLSDFGGKAASLITRLDEYIQTSGKRYRDHNLTMRNWARKDGIVPAGSAPAVSDGWRFNDPVFHEGGPA
jgi:hypothetical protein